MKGFAARLWAIAWMTLVEASRRKAFTILALFAVALLSSVTFFPSVEMKARLRLLEAWSLRATSLFAAIVALFFSGFSFPSDFETRRIYLLVTKPISKMTLFLGRFLGFALLLGLFLGLMGILITVFIRSISLLAGPAFPPLVSYPRRTDAEFVPLKGLKLKYPDRERWQVENEPGASLHWRFRGLDPRDFPPSVRGELRLILSSRLDPFRASGNVEIRAGAPGREPFRQRLFLQTHEEAPFTFPSTAIGEDGTLEVEVVPLDEDGRIVGWPESLAIYQNSVSFEMNFARGLLLTYLQSLLVLTTTLMASTFLSAPVSILLGIFLYLVGSLHSFVREGTRDIDRSLAESRDGAHRTHGPVDEIPRPVLKAASQISKAVLSVVPDFDRFDFSLWLLKDRAVSGSDLVRAAVPHAAIQIPVLVGLGMLVMAFKDFAQ